MQDLHDACRHGMNLTEILTAQQMGHNSSTSTDSCRKGASLNKYLNTEPVRAPSTVPMGNLTTEVSP